ncbi:hypothetical protein [Flavobacterium sp.]|uniref:hypothetical protein n=1 Tax=Flavobacterium sp. TaxID=239 RepID=UPI002603C1B8|nr:hypothetical protein [Flavobacterium sp.]
MKNLKQILITGLLLLTVTLQAQVGIGNIDPKATLDVSGKPTEATVLDGIIAPRITKAQLGAKTYTAAQNGAIIYVTAIDASVATQVAEVSEIGYYRFQWETATNTGSWKGMGGAKAQAKFFYMPSITIDVSTVATGQTLDLYTLYKNQFDSPAIKSTSAPADVPFFATATDLYYYVTSYDTNSMTITSINDSGLMTYNVSGLGTTPCSLLNIVFVYK